MPSERIPTAIHSSTLTIWGVELHVHVLDDGRRIIEAEDVRRLFAKWSEPGVVVTQEEADALARAIKGLPPKPEEGGPHE